MYKCKLPKIAGIVGIVTMLLATPAFSQEASANTPIPPKIVPVSPNGSSGQTLSLRVVENHLTDERGQAVTLHGVNLPAGLGCVPVGHGAPGVFVAPSATQAAAGIENWHANIVRITLNEDCWLGINGVSPAYSGSNYQNAIVDFVKLLHGRGIYAIVDLHTNAPGTIKAESQQVMADADHAAAYWKSVASIFKDDPAVIFGCV